MWLALILLTVTTSILISVLFGKNRKEYWQKHGVKFVHHSSIKDNIDIFIGKKINPDADEVMYRSLGENEKFCGTSQLGTLTFLAKDLEIVKKIMIKDFDHFVDHRSFATSKEQPEFEKTLFNLHGEEWKGVRNSLSPTFTTGKIRRMMECFNGVSNDWAMHFNENIKKNGGKSIKINVNKEVACYTIDVIAAAVFGMKTGTIKDADSLFSKMAFKLIDFSTLDLVKFGLSINFPKLVNLLKLKLLDDTALTFFTTILRRRLKEREEDKEKGNDFMQLVVEARKGNLKGSGSDELSAFEKEALLKNDNSTDQEKKNPLTDDVMAIAQLIQFFFAGFSTTQNFIGTVMYVLTLHQDCQDKLREEVTSQLFKDGGDDMDYDVLNKLGYLDMVLSEVLRLYPALARIERVCTKDYHDSEFEFRIPKGTLVAIPVQAIHRDKKYYEHPDKFFPEHFSPEAKANRNPYAWLPFGTGPRNCIGMRFALVESKAAIAHLIKNFRLEPTDKTPIPQKMKCAGIAQQLPDNLEIKLTPIN